MAWSVAVTPSNFYSGPANEPRPRLKSRFGSQDFPRPLNRIGSLSFNNKTCNKRYLEHASGSHVPG